MRHWWLVLILACALFTGAGVRLEAGAARIIKVLPHFVDHEGRIALSPSLFERDAYQAVLRRDRSLCSTMRFDVQWKAGSTRRTGLKLKLELLTTTTTRERPLVVEAPVKTGFWSRRWNILSLAPAAFRESGDLIAWRATLSDADGMIAEQKSFLW